MFKKLIKYRNAGDYSGDPATVGTQVIEALQQQGIEGQEYGVIIEEEEQEEVVDDPQYHIEEDFDENTADYQYQQVENEETEEHDTEEEDDKKEMMHCDVCDKGFKTSAGLKRHITVNHTDEQNEEDPLTLQLCPCCGEPSDTAHTVQKKSQNSSCCVLTIFVICFKFVKYQLDNLNFD